MKKELKRCPFCHELPSVFINAKMETPNLVRYDGSVCCTNYLCHVRPEMKFTDTNIDTVYEMIIKYWNQREEDLIPVPPNTKKEEKVESNCFQCACAEFGPDGTWCGYLGKNIYPRDIKDCDAFRKENPSKSF